MRPFLLGLFALMISAFGASTVLSQGDTLRLLRVVDDTGSPDLERCQAVRALESQSKEQPLICAELARRMSDPALPCISEVWARSTTCQERALEISALPLGGNGWLVVNHVSNRRIREQACVVRHVLNVGEVSAVVALAERLAAAGQRELCGDLLSAVDRRTFRGDEEMDYFGHSVSVVGELASAMSRLCVEEQEPMCKTLATLRLFSGPASTEATVKIEQLLQSCDSQSVEVSD